MSWWPWICVARGRAESSLTLTRPIRRGEVRGVTSPPEPPEISRASPAVQAIDVGVPRGSTEIQEIPWISRAVWFLLFATPASVFVTAWTLTPNPVGHGTHVQLGLPPCGFYVVTGLPCPGCGLTTCFAYMMDGQWIEATRANPFGVMLFLVSFCCAVTALVGLIRGWPVLATLERLYADRWALLLATTSLLVWGVRVATLWALS